MMATISGSRVFRAAKSVTGGLWLTLHGDDQLGDHWQHLGAALLKHVEDTLHGQEAVGVLLLSDAFEEDGQVVVVVELLDLHFPVDLELGAMLNGDWEVSSVVETAELARWDGSHVKGSGLRLLRCRLFLGLVKTNGLSSETFSFLKGS